MAALGLFMADLVRATGKRTIWLVIYFVGVMSASTGIANKSTNLAMFVVSTFLIMPRDPVAAPASRRAPAPARSLPYDRGGRRNMPLPAE
jgi:hypothetical protein